MPQHTANSNQQRGQDFNRPWATNAASSSSGGALTQPRDEAAPARLRMACGACCLLSCYVKERVKMAMAQQLDVATSGECVAVLTCPPYGPSAYRTYTCGQGSLPRGCTRASLRRTVRGTLDCSVLTARVP